MVFRQKLNSHRIYKRLEKALTGLRVCAGLSEPLLVAHTTLLEITCHGSIMSCECFTQSERIGDSDVFVELTGLIRYSCYFPVDLEYREDEGCHYCTLHQYLSALSLKNIKVRKSNIIVRQNLGEF